MHAGKSIRLCDLLGYRWFRRAELTLKLVRTRNPAADQAKFRIADTKCDGFGLRVWPPPLEGRAGVLDLRAKGCAGRSTRRTYKPRYGSPNLTFTR